MGTWGAGNLDSDGALDCVGEMSRELVESVWALLQSKTSPEADEWEYDELFVKLEWVIALEDAGVFNGWDLPPVAQLDPVLDIWFAAWADYFDGLAGPEFKAERGSVIKQTFEKLKAICALYEERRG